MSQNNPNNIWAVGRNYTEHAKEMGAAVPQEPLIFLKAGSSAVRNGAAFALPAFSKDVHHEIELAYRFDDRLRLTQVTVAIDLTARDIQAELKAKGLPWTLAKSFKCACLLGDFVPVTDLSQPLEFELRVNGAVRQHGVSSQMVFSPDQIAKYVLERFPVVAGDVLLTGTPVGVSALVSGDKIEAKILGKTQASWSVLS